MRPRPAAIRLQPHSRQCHAHQHQEQSSRHCSGCLLQPAYGGTSDARRSVSVPWLFAACRDQPSGLPISQGRHVARRGQSRRIRISFRSRCRHWHPAVRSTTPRSGLHPVSPRAHHAARDDRQASFQKADTERQANPAAPNFGRPATGCRCRQESSQRHGRGSTDHLRCRSRFQPGVDPFIAEPVLTSSTHASRLQPAGSNFAIDQLRAGLRSRSRLRHRTPRRGLFAHRFDFFFLGFGSSMVQSLQAAARAFDFAFISATKSAVSESVRWLRLPLAGGSA